MLGGFGGGGMQGRHRRAGEFELATGLQRDGAAPFRIFETDRIAIVEDGLPAGAAGNSVKQSMNTVGPGIRHRSDRIAIKHVLFVLGADAPFRFGF